MSVDQEPDFILRFPIHRACRDGDVGALLSLSRQLSDQTPLIAEDSCYGWSPLHWAAHYGQLECMAQLVQMGCEVNAASSRFNQTPAHTAAFGGHPHCVVWLTQAGADVNRQDLVGEAPIHKAARSGSLECVQVLLIAGAKPHLRNASGQTAADLAHAHGFLDCFCFISDAQKPLLQLSGLHGNGTGPCGQGLGRKRLLTAADSGHMKKARRAENVLLQMHINGVKEVESINMESTLELSSADDDTKAVTNGNHHHHMLPFAAQDDLDPSTLPPPTPASTPPPPSQRPTSDMCGSLHLSASPGSCASHRPAWWGPAGNEFGDDFQQYGHYHGFGDTAEELSDAIQAEHRYKQAVAGAVHVYHGS